MEVLRERSPFQYMIFAPDSRFLSRGGSGHFARLETLPAEDRPPLCGSERYRRFPSTLRTYGRRLYPPRTRRGPIASGLPSGFAASATLRLVLEVLLIIKLLLARGEYEIGSAVRALQHPILKFRHFRPS
jgi:hypothetical protein